MDELKELIVRFLTMYRYELSSEELANQLNLMKGTNYKKNSISEVCTRLCAKKKINKKTKPSPNKGRPIVIWFV